MVTMLANQVPTLVLLADDAEGLFKSLGTTAKEVFEKVEADEEFLFNSKKEFRLAFTTKVVKAQARNVVAKLEGSSKKEEALVYSAHMDHVGRAADGGVFNGADDNGSGTSTLLELAEAYASLEKEDRPARSVIFLSVSGEELGLWGSDHYAKNPTWPLDKIIANINIDMVGRSTEDVPKTAISVTPTHTHARYSSLAREAAFLGQAFDLAMRNGDRFYTRSDHYNFAKNGIPVVFFCDDEHFDYHMPSDTPDKIEVEKVARVGQLAFLLGYRTLNAEELPSELGGQADWFEGR